MSTKDQVAQLIVGEAKARNHTRDERLTKTCSRCLAEKSADEFNNNCGAKDGKRSECKNCQSGYGASYYADNADQRRAASKARYNEKAEQINAKNRDYQLASRQAITERNRARRKNAPEKSRITTAAYHLKHRYNLPADDYDRMLELQQGRCANRGCSNESSADRRLDVDHDHACCSGVRTCGACIRGLLCRSCNQALGFIHDDISRLRGLADYLERHSGRPS